MCKSLFINNIGSLSSSDVILVDNCRIESVDFELSDAECAPTHLSVSSAPVEFSTTACINTDLLNQMIGTPSYDNPEFMWRHDLLIMIQTRWHKKARIRKKWLKRYGMKYDTVTARYVGKAVTWDTQSGSWEFYIDKDKVEYLWRPHQKRRGTKIEPVYISNTNFMG